MPRHNSLIPLSHDHHNALLVALRLKKGGPSSIHDTLWPTDHEGQVRSLLLFAEQELFKHFELEEEILFPAISALDELSTFVAELIEDHQLMRSQIDKIRSLTQDSDIAHLLSIFGVLLENHIRKEERQFFPKLEEAEANGRFVFPKLR